MNWDSRERRDFVRISLPLEIYLSGSSCSLPAKTQNVSAGGLHLLLKQKFTPGTIVNLDIYGIQEKPLSCQGKIIWVFSRKVSLSDKTFCYDTGIEFYRMKKGNIQAIQKIIADACSNE